MRIITTIALLLAAASAHALDYSALRPSVELRGIWLDAGAIPKTRSGVGDLVRSYRDANINAIFPEVVARGYTVYPSTLIARDPRFTNAPDVLALLIEAAHQVGIEVHPWVWVFRAGYAKDKGAILTSHPDWAERGRFGDELSPNGGLWISPAIPEARDFLASIYAELVRNYAVDGIHLDYIRYEVESPIPYGFSDISRAEFQRRSGLDPLEVDRLSCDYIEWIRFRERLINTFVQRVATQTRAIRPDAKVSAAVGSDPTTSRLSLMQNWVNWIDNRWVDFVTPMAYTASDDAFSRLVSSQVAAVGCRTILAPGIGLHLQKGQSGQTVCQVGISRSLGAFGQTLFASSYFADSTAQALKQGPYSQPAKLPFRSPEVRSRDLREQASKSYDAETGNYYARMSETLAQYAAYLRAERRYVPPSPPPLSLPAVVLPIPNVTIPRISEQIIVDGELSEPAWRSAARVEIAYTNDGKPASQPTSVLIAHDGANIYLAFDCREPEVSRIKASATKRDGPTFYDDSVEVFIDPTGQGREYFHLSTNTIGTQFDQRVFSPSWNADWKTAAKVGQSAWTAEMSLPMSAVGIEPTPGAGFTLNLTRNRATSGALEHFAWSVPYGSFHSPDRFGRAVPGD